MPPLPPAAFAFPAFWLFLLGCVLLLGIVQQRRERLDVRDDWNRLVRLSDTLKVVEATRGRDERARVELIALARALDASVPPAEGRPGLTAQAGGFDPGERPAELPAAMDRRADALRADLLLVDRVLQGRMKAADRAAGGVGRVVLAGLGAVLLLPLEAGRRLGLVERLTERRVQDSLWFQGALGILVFVLLAGTAYSALEVLRVAVRVGRDLELWP